LAFAAVGTESLGEVMTGYCGFHDLMDPVIGSRGNSAAGCEGSLQERTKYLRGRKGEGMSGE
jgi:hypothetical protein